MPRPYDPALFADLHHAWLHGESLRSLARRTPYHRETLTHALYAYDSPPPPPAPCPDTAAPPPVAALDWLAAWLLDRALYRTQQRRLYVEDEPDATNHPWTDHPRRGHRRRARPRSR